MKTGKNSNVWSHKGATFKVELLQPCEEEWVKANTIENKTKKLFPEGTFTRSKPLYATNWNTNLLIIPLPINHLLQSSVRATNESVNKVTELVPKTVSSKTVLLFRAFAAEKPKKFAGRRRFNRVDNVRIAEEDLPF